MKDTKTAQDAADEAAKHLHDLPPSMAGYTYYQRKYFQMQSQLDMAKQTEHYNELRLFDRKDLITRKYLQAFKAGTQWPPDFSEELKAFSTKNIIESAPRAWSSRVPKWTRGLASQDGPKKAVPTEHSSAHEEHGE